MLIEFIGKPKNEIDMMSFFFIHKNFSREHKNGSVPAFENFVFFGRQTRKNRVFMGILRSTLYKKRHYAPLLLKLGDTRGSNSATPPLP